MSTQPSAHLNFEPAEALVPAEEAATTAAELRQQAAATLAAHRARRGSTVRKAASVAPPRNLNDRSAKVAAAVAARYARAQSYRDFLATEAEEALHRAEAAAEVAQRNAEAIAAVQQEMLRELDMATPLAAESIAPVELNIPAELNVLAEIAHWNGPALVEEPAAEPVAAAPDALTIAVEHFTPEQVGASSDFAAVPVDVFDFGPPEPVAPLPANLIEFPRVLVASRKARPRLAEGPLRDEADAEDSQLRIFEVDTQALSSQMAHTSALPEWSSIRLDAAVPVHAVEHPQTPVSFAIPLQTAELRPRAKAVAVDTSITLGATALFTAVFAFTAHHIGLMPDMKFAAITVAAVFLLLKLAYQFLFFTLNEATPGMRMARIALCTFGDDNPTRSALRRRIGATVLAACPMGLGLIWGWFDVDRLGWHDRMTRTYQRSY